MLSVASGLNAGEFDGFGQASAHRSKDESGYIALWRNRQVGRFAGKFGAAI
jgi:hypothetical protein